MELNKEQSRYRLQRKEPYAQRNILGNHSMPVHTYRWKDIAVSSDLEELKKHLPNNPDYRIIDVFFNYEMEKKIHKTEGRFLK